MAADVTSTTKLDFVAVLTQAATAYQEDGSRPAADEVVNALLAAEKSAKQQRIVYPFDALLGKWQLCFATGTKKVRQRGGIILGKGFYLPKFTPAHIGFYFNQELFDATPGRGEISNQIQLGALSCKLSGLAHYMNKNNLLAFDFNYIEISFFNRRIYQGTIRGSKAQLETFYQQSITKLAFFTFFFVTPDLIAARGRGGGLALWIREHE